MSKNTVSAFTRQQASILATNKVLRNTYLLLGMTFLFSAFTAYLSYATSAR
jgi:modulator of FtsH protease